MNTRFTLVLVALIIGFGGVFWFNKNKQAGTTNSSNVQPTNHIKGEGKSGVTLVEYGDFECPACWQYEPLVTQLYEKYQKEIFFQFRHFPLTQIHQHALAGHRAAEAASKQGKFWEMHDILFLRGHQKDTEGKVRDTEWTATNSPASFFEQYAQNLGLDVPKFKADMSSAEVNDLINADKDAGNKLDLTGTPSFILNGKKIDNPRDLDSFSKIIDAAIAAAKKT